MFADMRNEAGETTKYKIFMRQGKRWHYAGDTLELPGISMRTFGERIMDNDLAQAIATTKSVRTRCRQRAADQDPDVSSGIEAIYAAERRDYEPEYKSNKAEVTYRIMRTIRREREAEEDAARQETKIYLSQEGDVLSMLIPWDNKNLVFKGRPENMRYVHDTLDRTGYMEMYASRNAIEELARLVPAQKSLRKNTQRDPNWLQTRRQIDDRVRTAARSIIASWAEELAVA